MECHKQPNGHITLIDLVFVVIYLFLMVVKEVQMIVVDADNLWENFQRSMFVK